MHEMAIATELVRHVLEVAEQHGAARVEEVVVQCGPLRQVVPEALELSFAVVAEGTMAAGARLCVVEESIVAVCGQCQYTFGPQIDNFLCPQCGQADARIVSGNGVILKSVVCQQDAGAAES